MKKLGCLRALSVFFSLLLSFSAPSEAQVFKLGEPWLPGEAIVKVTKGISFSPLRSNRSDQAKLRSTLLMEGDEGDWYLVRGDLSTEILVESLRSSGSVLAVEPNYRVRSLTTIPNDPLFSDQWWSKGVGSLNEDVGVIDGWSRATAGGGVVAVLDTGIDYNHVDLAQNMWINPNPVSNDLHGYDFVNDDGDPIDDNYHGTHCAGIIGAVGDNRLGVSGVFWNGSLMAVKCLDSGGYGDVATVVKGLDYVLKMKKNGVPVVVINGAFCFGGYSQAAFDAIQALSKESIMFVAAAGNSASDNDVEQTYPAGYDLPNVISVANMDRDGKLNDGSSFGLKSVHLAAPGTDVLSTFPSLPYDPISGDRSLFFDGMEAGGNVWIVSGDWELGRHEGHLHGTKPFWRSPESSWKLTFKPGGGEGYLTLRDPVDISEVSNDLEVYAGAYVRGWYNGFWGYDDEWVSLQCQPQRGGEWFDVARLGKGGLDHLDFGRLVGRIPREMRTDQVRFRFMVSWSSGTDPSGSFFYLDDFGIGLPVQTERYELMTGTSVAASFVSGAVSLLNGLRPEESMDTIRWRILRGTTPMEGLKGKVATGGALNVNSSMEALPPQFMGSFPLDGGRLGLSGTLDWNFKHSETSDVIYRLFLGAGESGEMEQVYEGNDHRWVLPDDLDPGLFRWQVVAVDRIWGTGVELLASSDLKALNVVEGFQEIGSPVSKDLLRRAGLEGRLYVSAPMSLDVSIPETQPMGLGDLGPILPEKGSTHPDSLSKLLGVKQSDILDQMSFSVSKRAGYGNRAFFDVTLSVHESELKKLDLPGYGASDLDVLNRFGLFVVMGSHRWELMTLVGDRLGDLFWISKKEDDGKAIYDVCWTVCIVDGKDPYIGIMADGSGRGFFLVQDGVEDGVLKLPMVLSREKGEIAAFLPGSGGCSVGPMGLWQAMLLLGLPLLLRAKR